MDRQEFPTLADYAGFVARLRAEGLPLPLPLPLPVLMLGNDDATAYDEAMDWQLLTRHPRALLEQALDLLGLPHERV